MEDLKSHILNTFEAALRERNICVYYQPVIRTVSNRLCGFEALSRWIDPEYGMIGPDRFIPILEEHRLIHRLDLYVVESVCIRLRKLIDSKNIPIPISFNLSRLDFDLCDVFTEVETIVKKYRIPNNLLNIEITESTIADHEDMMRAVIEKFHNAGHQVWMDDFGSGYSSLNALKDFTFDELKLDMRFMSSFHVRAQRILTSVVQMAKEIDIHTLAEGVETEEQFVYLRDIGCEKVQGYYFGRPLPFEESMAGILSRGIMIEEPRERKYYDEIGRTDVLSAVPFMSRDEKLSSTTGKDLNSLPLAILEIRKSGLRLLFYNTEFKKTVTTLSFITPEIREHMFTDELASEYFPVRMMDMLNITRQDGIGKLNFVSNEEYYEVKAKRIAQTKDTCSMLLQLHNLSKRFDLDRIKRLDEGLRQIYELFDRVICLDLTNDTVEPVYIGPREKMFTERASISELFRNYCEKLVFSDDREAYLRFMDTSDMMTRIARSQHGYLVGYFRTASSRIGFVWKQYILLRLNSDSVLELVRDAEMDIHEFREFHPASATRTNENTGFTPELLWTNLIHSGVLRLFWKDNNRRFQGATKGFLDYYDFPSVDSILGKTDEDMGWHVHPTAYMNDELQVLEEGKPIWNIPGNCISQGRNQDIIASKWPIFDEDGKIKGLMGFFMDREFLEVHDNRGQETKLRDILTGLYNSRGISEVEHAFRDEYYLRNVDFVKFNIAIDNFPDVNKYYGFDFGDKVLKAVGQALKKAFGQTSAVARVSGYQFVVLHQIHDKNAPEEMRKVINEIPAGINDINGIPFNFYVSCGYSLFSESEDLDEQSRLAEIRQLADHGEDTTVEIRMNRSTEIFRMFDDLPIAYAVYKVQMGEDKKVLDTTIFYVNHRFARTIGMDPKTLLGRGTREMIPDLDENWYSIAYKAAIKGEVVFDRIHLNTPDVYMNVTASQVIHPGYAAFTYQVVRN